MKRLVRSSARLLAICCLAIGLSSQAFAQAVEAEPNDACTDAQDLGEVEVTGAVAVEGSLDSPPDEPDVDFFRLSATPGTRLVADHEGEDTGAGTLPDPFLGLFDGGCNLLASNDDAAGGFDSRLAFDVPADGVFILAATSFGDDQFTGDGNSGGTYRLTTALAPPSIGAISGRIVNASAGEPLTGNEPPFAFAELYRCEGEDCFEFVNSQSTDGEGRFRFDLDSNGEPLTVGTYEIRAAADEFEQAGPEPFEVGEGEAVDVGEIALDRPPIWFSDIRTCDDLAPDGDTCRYSVRVTNNTDARVRGLAWSIIDGSGLDSGLTVTTFEASTRAGSGRAVRERFVLEPLDETRLRFQFKVPPVAIGATFCARVAVGIDPDPLVTTVREAFLFCLSGTDAGLEAMSQAASRKIFQSLSGKSRHAPALRPAPAG
jgi:hypothetical protein